MRKTCIHGTILPKGLRCDHGYIQVFIRSHGVSVCRNFGLHTPVAQKVAEAFLGKKRYELLERGIGIEPAVPSKKFEEAANLWFEIWKKERNPDGGQAHNKESCYKVRWTLDSILIPAFKDRPFEAIRAVDIDKWRRAFVDKGRSGVTANRYQAILSSIFSHIEKWVKCERIKPAFKLPAENPCRAVEMAPQRKRSRILSKYEASKLKLAFMQLNDLDGWEICKMALKSVLSMKDLKNLEIGDEIDTERSKTGVSVNIPLPVLTKLNFFGWRTRWNHARETAGLNDVQFRDLRKTGINWLKGSHELKLISEYAGHANIRTTEKAYTVKQSEYLAPLARDIEAQVDAI